MRIRVGRLPERLLLVGGPVVGALLATGDVGRDPVGRTTHAACTSGLPGTAARCDADRVVAGLSPYVGPGLLGLAAGLAVAVLVVLLARAVGRNVTSRAPARVAAPVQPAWFVTRPGTQTARPVPHADAPGGRRHSGARAPRVRRGCR